MGAERHMRGTVNEQGVEPATCCMRLILAHGPPAEPLDYTAAPPGTFLPCFILGIKQRRVQVLPLFHCGAESLSADLHLRGDWSVVRRHCCHQLQVGLQGSGG